MHSNKEISIAEHLLDTTFSTVDNQKFLRSFILDPAFVPIWSSDYQLNKLNQIEDYSELFIDGTFKGYFIYI